jgi:hypothetical protein
LAVLESRHMVAETFFLAVIKASKVKLVSKIPFLETEHFD